VDIALVAYTDRAYMRLVVLEVPCLASWAERDNHKEGTHRHSPGQQLELQSPLRMREAGLAEGQAGPYAKGVAEVVVGAVGTFACIACQYKATQQKFARPPRPCCV
jgi:hypothetical protein